MAASYRSTCAVLDSGSVKCWGNNTFGQIGPSKLTNLAVPRTVPGLERMLDVTGGYGFNCALGISGAVRCWGSSVPGLEGSSDATAEVLGLDGVSLEFAAGKLFACALMKHGEVRCWGHNNYGELGDGTTVSRATAADVVGLGGPAVAIAAGNFHACALLKSGHVQCWGLNEYAQNGDGTLFIRTKPRWVTGLDGVAVSIAAGPNQTCVVMEDGTPRCWGKNDVNQLGNGDFSWIVAPETVRN